ncbi:uncharacterized protein LOC133924107 [Phragmites australis]|uniref:uncharacterized protein LOC133924107 n=1 Tax=Phragmites australis TaxID=29695 RepID=UPI002D79211A|nr:uncharacterized protein LOC133924107 [Phragmites australis]
MDAEEIFGWDIGEAKEQVLEFVKGWPEKKIIYFHGWNGLGASPVLRSIAQALSSMKMDAPRELCFDRIIYIDCSAWKSRREMQRAIAEELELDHTTMAMFNKQDEEDDFNGLDQDSRDVIPSIATEIDRTLRDCRFMMIFLNGSDDEVDVTRFGIPQMTEFRNNRMIWTFKRRFLTIHSRCSEIEQKLKYSHLFLSAELVYGEYQIKESEFVALVHGEAATIVARYPCMPGIDSTIVTECCLLELSLHYNFHNTTKFGWAAHSSNYWICDGIIQGDREMEISNALLGEIRWECDASLLHRVLQELKPTFLAKMITEAEPLTVFTRCLVKDRWISITSQEHEVHGMQNIPATASSFFLAFERPGHLPPSERSAHPPALEGLDSPTALPSDMFNYSRRLSVLVLYYCAFSFASPPFLICNSLRFLGLDHCKQKTREREDHIDTEWTFLLSLWVLEVRYTEWEEMLSEEKMDLMTNLKELNIEGVRCWQYINQLRKRLPHLYRLRITKPRIHHPETTDVGDSFMDKEELQILDLSGNSEMNVLPSSLSKASSLQVLVLDGCIGLECVAAPDTLPPSLMSFSLDGYGAASHWTPDINLLPPKNLRPSSADQKDAKTSKISLEGCTSLENLFLRGLPNLVELDLSGTGIKILDFTTMVVEVTCLRRLFLLGCERLVAIIWDQKSRYGIQPQLELLCIDTRAGAGFSRPSVDHNNKSFRLQVHAIFSDARLARSLWPAVDYYRSQNCLEDVYFNILVTSAPVYSGEDVQPEATHRVLARRYGDVHAMVGDAPMQDFPQAPTADFDRHVEIAQGSRGLESELLGYNPARNNLALLMRRCADSLHLHDVSTSANMPVNEWNYLRHCRVERCSKLDTLFPSTYGFEALETLWASDLLMARCIWGKGGSYYRYSSFGALRHLHLRSCPRLRFVLPVLFSSFPSLETLHIIHCGDLRHIFVLDEEHPETGIALPNLTTIHLHDLPMLQQICEDQMLMLAPALMTIKIRGCWDLRRLPAMEGRGLHMKKPTVEIEKDVWDALEWDGVEAGHHSSLFEKPRHSRYYKKKLLRGSALR